MKVLFLTWLLLSLLQQASPGEELKIGVCDLKKVVNEFALGADPEDSTPVGKLRNEYAKKRKALAKLATQRPIRPERRSAFLKQVKKAQQDLIPIHSAILDQAKATMNEVAKMQKLDFVFDKSAVSVHGGQPLIVHSKKSIDLTKEILRILTAPDASWPTEKKDRFSQPTSD